MMGLELRGFVCGPMCWQVGAQAEVCGTLPPPPFFVNADSKGFNVHRKPFRMNTCGHFLEVFILKGLQGQKTR